MSENKKITEQHGCIVCGKTYNTLVIYSPDGRFIDATVTSPGGKRVSDPDRPIVACTTHIPAEIEQALTTRYPGQQQDEDEDN